MQIENHKLLNKNWLKTHCIDILFVVVTLSLLFYRISLAADRYDEIINLNVSYAVTLGRIPFLESREAYQSGDFFLTPFLWVYVFLRGSTEGIVLFSRFVYFGFLCLIGIFVYHTFKRNVGKKAAFYLGYLCLFFQVHCLYYLWYDTSCILTLTLTLLLLYNAVTLKKKYLFVIAGISAAAMSFSYPTMLLMAVGIPFIFLFVGKMPLRKRIESILFYCLGGFLIAGISIIVVHHMIGIRKLISMLKNILSMRSINMGSQSSPFSILSDICCSFLNVNCFLILPSLFLLWLFFKALSQKKFELPFVLGIVFFSFINNTFFVPFIGRGYAALNGFLGYIALWAPFLYYLKPNRCISNKNILIFIWLPSFLAPISIALGTKYTVLGPVKSWHVLFPAALCSLIFINNLICDWIDSKKINKGRIFQTLFLPTMSIILLFNYSSYIYGGRERPSYDKVREQRGIYAGIKVADNDDMQRNLWIEKIIEENRYSFKNCHTIAVNGSLLPIYLMTDIKPLVPSVGSFSWEFALPYYEEIGANPDILVLLERDYNDESRAFIDEYYTLFNTYENYSTKIVIFLSNTVLLDNN